MDRMEFGVEDEKDNFYKIDYGLFVISLAVVFGKAVIGYWSTLTFPFVYIFNAIASAVLYLSANSTSLLWSATLWLMNPLIIGIMMSFITWQIVYFDSAVPGITPATPFTYNKYRSSRSKHRYHLCYLFALAVAPLTTVSLIVTNYTSQMV